ncbi:sigma-70 family RNA polymerase sigma factor [Faecalispora anaeroviscerum]|uniref:sigma-70 family RNA polymerase sigma factor n=1 Tax=Faecalispora anaeroviscerum TaxID=2991836 RepID=UPI0024B9D260|nr:sigma-70 family RNA polymerase sigma factor [Faecalispora anaeroviscerum]
MANNVAQQNNRLPKRRKSKENPYTIGYDEARKIYTLSFVDGQRVLHCLDLSDELYQIFNQFELDDLSELNEKERNIDFKELELALKTFDTLHSNQTETAVYKSLQKRELYKAIATLPEKQRRRVVLYYFNGLTYEEIGQLEKCQKTRVKKSIDRALSKIKKYF